MKTSTILKNIIDSLKKYIKKRSFDMYYWLFKYETERLSIIEDIKKITKKMKKIDWLDEEIQDFAKENTTRIVKTTKSFEKKLYNDFDGKKTIEFFNKTLSSINDLIEKIKKIGKVLEIGNICFFFENEKIIQISFKESWRKKTEIKSYNDLKDKKLDGSNQRGLSILYAIAKQYQITYDKDKKTNTLLIDVFAEDFQKNIDEFVDMCKFTNFKRLYDNKETDIVKRSVNRFSHLRKWFLEKYKLNIEIQKKPGRKPSTFGKIKNDSLVYSVIIK